MTKARNSKTMFTATEIETILRSCKENGVAQLKFGPLEVNFDPNHALMNASLAQSKDRPERPPLDDKEADPMILDMEDPQEFEKLQYRD